MLQPNTGPSYLVKAWTRAVETVSKGCSNISHRVWQVIGRDEVAGSCRRLVVQPNVMSWHLGTRPATGSMPRPHLLISRTVICICKPTMTFTGLNPISVMRVCNRLIEAIEIMGVKNHARNRQRKECGRPPGSLPICPNLSSTPAHGNGIRNLTRKLCAQRHPGNIQTNLQITVKHSTEPS